MPNLKKQPTTRRTEGSASIPCRVEQREAGSRVRTFVATTSAVATDGGVLLPDGLDATVYDRRPIVLWAHADDDLGVGRCIARRRISVPDGWEVDIDFAPPEVSTKADDVLRFLDWAGFGAVSIRWRFLEVDWNPEPAELIKYGLPRYGWIGRRWQLTEISVVNCQADPEALMKHAVDAGVLSERRARDLLVTEEPSGAALDQFAGRIERALEAAVVSLTDLHIAMGERVGEILTRLPAPAAAPTETTPATEPEIDDAQMQVLYQQAQNL